MSSTGWQGVGSYWVAAYSRTMRRALAGLAVTAVGFAVYSLANHDIMGGAAESLWASAFFAVGLLAAWLVGVFVHGRWEAVTQALRTAAAERQAEQAVADERARMARELHDVVSHNLSVVVLQAAGARAAGSPDAGTLEKIERSGRQALVEMRRLLGVLRQPGDQAAGPELAPQPGVAELGALVDGVRAAGLPVTLVIDGDPARLPAAVDISAYWIVQEAHTNVLKHAGRATAEVSVRCGADEVLVGMRERVALFGGDLAVGRRPGGGFAVRARLPLDDPPRSAWSAS